MSYCKMDEDTKRHLLKLVSFIYDEVRRSSGDGDAIWYSRFYDVRDIFPVITEFNESALWKWDVRIEGGRIHWSNNQEGVLITNNKEDFDNRPHWQGLSIVL